MEQVNFSCKGQVFVGITKKKVVKVGFKAFHDENRRTMLSAYVVPVVLHNVFMLKALQDLKFPDEHFLAKVTILSILLSSIDLPLNFNHFYKTECSFSNSFSQEFNILYV